MPGEIRVGCSGWQYKDWRGVVYPEKLPQKRWFEHYATLFDTVEINNTFYRLPLRWAVEVRDPSWLHDDTFEVLRRHQAALCIHDLIEKHPWERTTDWTYVRFHGPDALKVKYTGRYTGRRLAPVAKRLAEWRDDG